MNSIGFDPTLGQQQFMELLITQIQHQDPFEPVAQEDFLTQLSQFSVAEGVQSLNVRFDDMLQLQTLFQGTQLAGKAVEFSSPTTGKRTQGIIDEARVSDGLIDFRIGNEWISLNDIHAVLASLEP